MAKGFRTASDFPEQGRRMNSPRALLGRLEGILKKQAPASGWMLGPRSFFITAPTEQPKFAPRAGPLHTMMMLAVPPMMGCAVSHFTAGSSCRCAIGIRNASGAPRH
jgi:hypothetical protein